MTNLDAVFDENYYNDKDITNKRLLKFTDVVRTRFREANMGGKLNAAEAELGDHAAQLAADLQAVDQGTGTRRGNAKMMWGAIRGLNQQLDADDELIWLKAKKNALIGTAFFPKGSRTEYGNANLLTVDLLFQRAVKAAHDHATALGDEFDPQKYDTLYQQFKDGRDGTQKGDAQVATGRADTADENRTDLELALTRATKLVASLYPHDPARAAQYFPTELLFRKEGEPEDDEETDTPPAQPAA
jgi:hypothetical protein